MGLDRGGARRLAPALHAGRRPPRHSPSALPPVGQCARQAQEHRGREPAPHRRLRARLPCARPQLSRSPLSSRGQARHGAGRGRLSAKRRRGARHREALRGRGHRAHSLRRRFVGGRRRQRHVEIIGRRDPHARHDPAHAHHPDRQGVDDGAHRGGHLRAAARGAVAEPRRDARPLSAKLPLVDAGRSGSSRRSSRRRKASGRRRRRPLPPPDRTSTSSSRARKARSASSWKRR